VLQTLWRPSRCGVAPLPVWTGPWKVLSWKWDSACGATTVDWPYSSTGAPNCGPCQRIPGQQAAQLGLPLRFDFRRGLVVAGLARGD
jgi:hypothetical protein